MDIAARNRQLCLGRPVTISEIPIPTDVDSALYFFPLDTTMAIGSIKARISHWTKFVSYLKAIPNLSLPLHPFIILQFAKDELGEVTRLKDYISTLICRSKQLNLFVEAYNISDLISTAQRRAISLLKKDPMKAPPATTRWIHATESARQGALILFWVSTGLRESGLLSLERNSLPIKEELEKLRKEGKVHFEFRVFKDKSDVYSHFMPIDKLLFIYNYLETAKLPSRFLPFSTMDVSCLLDTLNKKSIKATSHSFRRAFAISLRHKLDNLGYNDKAIKGSVLIRINKYVGWSSESNQFFNYSKDFKQYNPTLFLDMTSQALVDYVLEK